MTISAGFKGPTSKEKGGEGKKEGRGREERERVGREGKGKRRGRKGRECGGAESGLPRGLHWLSVGLICLSDYSDINVSQGSVAMQLRYGRIFYDFLITNFLLILLVKGL